MAQWEDTPFGSHTFLGPFYSGYVVDRREKSIPKTHRLYMAHVSPRVDEILGVRVYDLGVRLPLVVKNDGITIGGEIYLNTSGTRRYPSSKEPDAEELPTKNYGFYTGERERYLLFSSNDVPISGVVVMSKGVPLFPLTDIGSLRGVNFVGVVPPHTEIKYDFLHNQSYVSIAIDSTIGEAKMGGFRVFPDKKKWHYDPHTESFVSKDGEKIPFEKAVFKIMKPVEEGKTYDRPVVGFVAGIECEECAGILQAPLQASIIEESIIKGKKINKWPSDAREQQEIVEKAKKEGYHYLQDPSGNVLWSKYPVVFSAPPGVRWQFRTTHVHIPYDTLSYNEGTGD